MFPRSLFTATLLAWSALAGPPLTTIQDVLYKADGTRFNGTLTISWNSFQAVDSSAIVMQSTTVKVVDGNLRVQLVPTTTSSSPVYYSVTYNSDGRVQFQENWAVPASAQPLRVRDVRTLATSGSSNDTGVGTGPVAESDVVGLIADLGARPVKGPGFAAGRVAVVSPLGTIESAAGNASDCVRVDGSSGPCGAQPPSFVDGDAPAGIVDGANASFTLSAAPVPTSSLAVYRNGMLQKAGQDFTLTGTTIQFVAAAIPQPGDTLLASYRLSDAVTASPLFSSPQVLCSGTGTATGGTTLISLGSCVVPAGLLAAGDRVEIRFDFAHQGTVSGFTLEIDWGSTSLARRDAGASDALVSGRADAAILAAGTQFNGQSWGSVLPLAATVSSATGANDAGLTIDFKGKLGQAGDMVTLSHYTVVRFP
ncbi:MAG: hypothetical protein LAP87_08870 [Acidobacteriia bacterium]|nr:hypothetical protein [Terriglobia bacterium]